MKWNKEIVTFEFKNGFLCQKKIRPGRVSPLNSKKVLLTQSLMNSNFPRYIKVYLKFIDKTFL